MGKYERKKARKSRKGLVPGVLTAAILVALVAVLVSPGAAPGGVSTDGAETGTTMPTAQPSQSEPSGGTQPPFTPEYIIGTGETVEFPLQLEDGKLEIDSLFQFEGVNPDCGNQEGDRIAAIIIRNTSGMYLKSAGILAELADGTQIRFSVFHLPAGKEVLAFSVDNAQLEDNMECIGLRVQAEFEQPQTRDGLSVSVDGMTITVTNETGNTISGIDVLCHGVFGERYFGGTAYTYKIAELPAGESAAIIATDCLLGVAEVVRVAVNDG